MKAQILTGGSLEDLLAQIMAPDKLADMIEADKLGVAALTGMSQGGQIPEAIGNLLAAAGLLYLCSRTDENKPEEILPILESFTVAAIQDIFNDLHSRTHDERTAPHVKEAPLLGLRIASFIRGMSPQNTIPKLDHGDLVRTISGPLREAGQKQTDAMDREEAAAQAASEVKH